jgi:stage III sporulation protein AH
MKFRRRIFMKQESFKEKVGNFFSKLGKKNLIIIASFAVVAVALVVGITVFNRSGDKGFDYSQGAGMQDVNGESDKETESKKDSVDTYFSSVELDRKRTRDEALEVLQGVVDNASSTEEARASALAEISVIAKNMENESNIETLIEAKGFAECVAVIKDDSASIVVKSEGLQAAQISQINEIVYEQAGISPVNVKIIQR